MTVILTVIGAVLWLALVISVVILAIDTGCDIMDGPEE